MPGKQFCTLQFITYPDVVYKVATAAIFIKGFTKRVQPENYYCLPEESNRIQKESMKRFFRASRRPATRYWKRWGVAMKHISSCLEFWSKVWWSSDKVFKAWLIGDLLIFDRDLFFAIEITIGDRHFIKRSPGDWDREIQRSRSQKRDLFGDLGRHQYFYNFFKNLQKKHY